MKNVTNSKGGTLIYDAADWKAGLGPGGQFGSSVFKRQMTDNGFSRLDSVDPFSTYGALSPGTLYSENATNNTGMSGYMTAFSLTDNSTGLGVDSGGKVHQATVSGSALSITSAGSFPHTITGTSPVGQDGIIYRHKLTSTTYATSYFFSYYNNTNWNVGILSAFATFDDAFMSTTPSTPMDITTASPADGKDVDQRTKPHPMEVGADGVLYIGSGRFLHAFDGNAGTAGSFTSKVLTLPLGFEMTALKKFGNIFLIAGNYYVSASGTGEAQLYTWDYVSSDITSVTSLEDNYVSSLFMWKGAPLAITSGAIGRNGRVKLKLISGGSVRKLADFGLYADLPNNRGVVVVDDIIYLNAGGKLVAYGNKYESASAINYIAKLSPSGTSSGCLFWNELQSCFSGSSGTQEFYNINNGHGIGKAYGFAYAIPLPPKKIARLMEVRVEFYSTLSVGGTNGSLALQLSLDLNSSGTPTLINGLSSVALPLNKRYTQDTSSNQLNQQFTMISPLIDWTAGTGGSAPQISRLEIDYLLEDVNP